MKQNKTKRLASFVAAGVASVAIAVRGADAKGGVSVVAVEPSVVVGEASPDLWGIFFEDIDLSLDGGICAEMVRNPSFEHWEIGRWKKGLPFEYWQTLGAADLRIENYRSPCGGNTRYAKIRARKGSGFANEGFFGIAVEAGKEYRLRCRIRGNKAPIAVALERYGAGPAGTANLGATPGDWQDVDVILTAQAADARCRLAFRATADDEFAIDCVSLMPQDTVAGLFRRDLVEKLSALKPSFVRFPGGCWVEGDTMKEAYRWKKTLAPRWERAPQWNIWNYWSSNAVGFHEYLLLCEVLNAKPLFCINCGMSHKETVPMEKMGEFVQDALDCIEYCNGDVDTKWGAVRAANGHPAPFNLEYLEIGNENGGSGYEARYKLIADRVRAKYPAVKLIFNNWKSTRKMDVAPKDLRDDHFYNAPEWFAGPGVHEYDESKGDFGIFVGEYAVQRGIGPWGDLRGAIAEAAFMTGLERNADKVKLAAYAPLFANVEHTVWTPNLVYVSSDGSFASPSWNVQKLFSENRGTQVLKVSVETGTFEAHEGRAKRKIRNVIENVQASAMRSADGSVILKLVNCTEEPQQVEIKGLSGRVAKTVFTGPNRDAHNTLFDREAVKERTTSLVLAGCDTLPPLSLVIYRATCGGHHETIVKRPFEHSEE